MQPMWLLSDRRAVAFGSVMFASSALNNLFVTFYLGLFMGVSSLPYTYFFFGQTVYLVWNAVNDPVIGWLQDYDRSRSPAARRAIAIRWGGLLWCASFLLVWFPPPASASDLLKTLHFVLATCAYDGALTLVEVSHASLLAEITTDSAERAKFNAFAAAFAGLGSLTSFLGQWTWNPADLRDFRAAAGLVALGCWGVFFWSSGSLARSARNETGLAKSSVDVDAAESKSSSAGLLKSARESPATSSKASSILAFLRERLAHRNFVSFTLVHSVQSFDCAFEKSSFTIFLDRLAVVSVLASVSSESAGTTLSRGAKALVVGASFLLPWAGALVATPRIQAMGVYGFLRSVFVVRLLACAAGASMLLYATAMDADYALAAVGFLLANRVASEMVCRVAPLVVSDLVDEERYLKRRAPATGETRTASIVGAANFFPKIGSSLGPMLAFYVLSRSGEERAGVSLALVLVPGVCVALQLALWTFAFTLRGSELKKVKEYLSMHDSNLSLSA